MSAPCSASWQGVSGMELATVTCALCGRSFEKPARRVRARNSCCAAHARKWNAQRLADYNRLENPLNQPGGVVSNRRKRGKPCPAPARARHTASFTAGTSTGRWRRPCWAGPCGRRGGTPLGRQQAARGPRQIKDLLGVRATTPPISKSSRRNRSM